jgi:hypothetical protein
VNPDWQEGTPGAFAVVIGISTYLHLEGGEAPADETYGLGQLQVSALTAYRLFRWLAEDYQVSGCPLAKCWLLLSPTDQEREHTPAIAEHLTPPTFSNCRQALRFWRHHMAQLPPAAAETSRALFFFSGHGLEVHQEHQVLLPSDYLQPPEPSWNDAISTDNLAKGLAALAVPHQLFLLDACRNDHYELRAKRVTGTDILSEDESARVNPRLVAPMLYATASGQQAFQQPAPARGLSLFGQAQLDGLTGQPYIALDSPENNLCAVKLYPLQGFMKERVVQLLQAANAQVMQPIKLGGSNIDNELLTHLEMAAVPPRPPRVSDLPLVRGVHPDEAVLSAHEVERGLVGRFMTSDLGHEWDLWHQRIRLFALGQRHWLAPDRLVLHRVEKNAAQDTYQVTLSVASDDLVGYWLQIDDTAGLAYACILPVDRDAVPRYTLEFDVLRNARGQRGVSRLEGFLAIDNTGFLGEAAALWQRYRTSNVGEAVNAFERSGLEQMVRENLDSPLAVTTSALILLRANRLDLLHYWVRHLANGFEQWPDGSVLWAEQWTRQAADASHVSEAADYLLDLLQRGLPHTSETLGYAARRVTILNRPRAPLSEDMAASLDRLNKHLQEALVYFRPGGLFATYAGFPPDTDPTALVGPFSP